MTKKELMTYEAPTITEYISIDLLQKVLGKYVAWKINRKLKRYQKRLEIELFIKKLTK